MDERRKERRYSVRRDAFVWDFPGGRFHQVVVEDASRSGMQLQSERSLQHGSQIAVNLKGMIVWGTVQYCRPLKGWFASGIRMNHVDDRILEGVVSHPTGGFVTGGGQVASPSGADLLNTSTAGSAAFGFVSK